MFKHFEPQHTLQQLALQQRAMRNIFAAPPRTVDAVWRERLLLQDQTNAERFAAWRARRPYFVGYMEGER